MYLIGIDGGGTKTRAIVVNQAGEVVAHAECGGSNLNSTPAALVEQQMEQLIKALAEQQPDLQQQTAYIYGGFAGAYQIQNTGMLKQWLQQHCPNAQVSVSDDSMIALYAGTYGKPGIVQIVGTGSGTYGLSTTGERLRAGGWGYVIDDLGSGYYIGNEAMRAVFQAYDRRGPQTSLTEKVLAHFSLQEVPDLIRPIYSGDVKGILAPLSRYVSEEAAAGDAVSFAIIERAASYVANSLNCVAEQFGGTPVPVVLIGSVWDAYQFEQLVQQQVQFDAEWIRPRFQAEMGGIFAILAQLQLDVSMQQLEHSYETFMQKRGQR